MANSHEMTVIGLVLVVFVVLQPGFLLSLGYASNSNEAQPNSEIQKTLILGEAGWDNGSPSSIAINQKTNLIYIANRNLDIVTVVNASMNDVLKEISVGFSPAVIVVNPNTNLIYVTKTNAGTVTLIDGSSNEIVNTLELDNPNQFYSEAGIAINEMTNEIYVLTNNYSEDGNYASISIIDGLTNKIQQSFKVADLRWDYDVGDSARDIIINSKTNTAYVVLMFGDLYVVDGSAKTVSDRVTIGYEKTPHQVNVNEETNMVYVSNFNNQSISVIDGSANEIIKTIHVGTDPQGIAIDSATNTVYVVTYGREVAIVDGTTNKVKGKVPVEEFPERAAFNENNGFLYVTNTGSNSISAIDTRNPDIGMFFIPEIPASEKLLITEIRIYEYAEYDTPDYHFYKSPLSLTTIKKGTELVINGLVKNQNHTAEHFDYITEIIDSKGYTKYLHVRQGVAVPLSGQIGIDSEIPSPIILDESGNYTIKVFTWRNLDEGKPISLSAGATTSITIV